MQNRLSFTSASLVLAAALISAAVPSQAAPVSNLAYSCLQTCANWASGLSQVLMKPLPVQIPIGLSEVSKQITLRIGNSSLVDGSVTTASISRDVTSPETTDVFGSVAIPFKKLSALSKAKSTFEAIAAGTALTCDNSKCKPQTAAFEKTLGRVSSASIRDKMNAVNVAVNSTIHYTTDIENYGKQDVWAEPSMTLASQKGDCEDYALLKMAALAAEGISLKDMAIVVLYDTKRHFYHAILSVKVQDKHFILDNRRDQVLADKDLPDYQPLFSISDGRGYLHGSKVKNQALASVKGFDSVAPGEGADL